MKNINVNLVIIGGGPAGIAAGIYAAMDDADYLLIEAKDPCWFMETSINSHKFVDGFTGVSKNYTGTLLKNSFLDHYSRLGGKFLKAEVLGLFKKNNHFILKTKKSQVIASAVIITSGTTPRSFQIEGIEKFDKNVHFDCVADGKKYINEKVIVIGGRNAGTVAACYLHDLGCKVTIVEIKNEIQAKEKYQQWLKERDIKIYTSSTITELIGNKKLGKAVINRNGKMEGVEVDGIFIYAGRIPLYNFIKFSIEKDKEGYIMVDVKNETSAKGLFAAGDITPKLKQVITACGDGANAYYFANKYIQNKK